MLIKKISRKEILKSPILSKIELENVDFCSSLLGQKFFVHILGELKKTKSPFEINSPLVHMFTCLQTLYTISKIDKAATCDWLKYL